MGESPSPWRMLPEAGFRSPDSRTSRRISEHANRAFIDAAARADTKQVAELLPYLMSTVNVTARKEPNAVPSTALHVAAQNGHFETCEMLLAAGADPCCGRACRRALTPLHLARDGAIARLLLDSGAPPISVSPFQPDPAMFLRSQGRHEAADAILRWRCSKLNEVQRRTVLGGLTLLPPGAEAAAGSEALARRGPALAGGNGLAVRRPSTAESKRVVVPAMTCAELRLAHAQWPSSPAATPTPRSSARCLAATSAPSV